MEILIANHRLSIGGGESYLTTVAEQLQRLGHEVTIFAPERGETTESTRERGLRVVESEEDLPSAPDVVYSLDSVVAYLLADRFPTTPQVFNMLAEEYDVSVPPQLPGVTGAVVVLHDRVARRARSLAQRPSVVRMRQPIDTQRFAPHTPLRDPPRRVLLLGNYLRGDRRALLEQACEALGLECIQLGSPTGSYTLAPEQVICQVDIVVGKARVILEAMACGRAAFVYDRYGGDGWVTPERYEALEADNFAGLADDRPMSAAELRTELGHYRTELGVVGRELVLLHHSAMRHAHALVELFRRVSPRREAVPGPHRELARLTRATLTSEHRVTQLANDVARLTQERDLLATENRRLLAEREQALESAEATIRWAKAVDGSAREAIERQRAMVGTRRLHFANALAFPLDKLRQLRSTLRLTWNR